MKTYPDLRELIRSKILLNTALWEWVKNSENHFYIELEMEVEGFSQSDWIDYLNDVAISYNQHTNQLSIMLCITDYDNEPWSFFVPVNPQIEQDLQQLAYKAAVSGDSTKFYAPFA